MKKIYKILSSIIAFTLLLCFCLTGCKFESNDIRAPQELTIFNSTMSLEQFDFDYLKIEYNSNDSVMMYDYNDMVELFNLADELVLTKSHEDEHNNHLPEDFDFLCSVSFVKQGTDGRPDVSYYFYVSTTGEICYLRDMLAANTVFYMAESTAILNEVNRLIELYG